MYKQTEPCKTILNGEIRDGYIIGLQQPLEGKYAVVYSKLSATGLHVRIGHWHIKAAKRMMADNKPFEF